jgi:hypothetical protein
MRLILSTLLILATAGCAPQVTPQSIRFQHDGYDKATEPFQADFAAPNGGYLFPFRDMIIEVTFRRDTMVDAYVYDKTGKPVHLDDRMKFAGLGIYPPGGINRQFTIQMARGGTLNHFRGKATIYDIQDVDRAMSLRFSFVLPDPNNNFTQRQCHEGHWAAASPRVQEMSASKTQ